MRALTARCALALSAAVVGLGCQASESAHDSAVAAATATAPWYQRARVLDLTGDGRVDSARLEAVGTHVDNLRVSLSLFVQDQERHREEWGSSYELGLTDSTDRILSDVEAILRAKLDSVLTSLVVQPIGAPGVRLMAEDSTILAGLEPRPTHRVSFSYGFETTVRLVWDAPRERFVRLWSCC